MTQVLNATQDLQEDQVQEEESEDAQPQQEQQKEAPAPASHSLLAAQLLLQTPASCKLQISDSLETERSVLMTHASDSGIRINQKSEVFHFTVFHFNIKSNSN